MTNPVLPGPMGANRMPGMFTTYIPRNLVANRVSMVKNRAKTVWQIKKAGWKDGVRP